MSIGITVRLHDPGRQLTDHVDLIVESDLTGALYELLRDDAGLKHDPAFREALSYSAGLVARTALAIASEVMQYERGHKCGECWVTPSSPCGRTGRIHPQAYSAIVRVPRDKADYWRQRLEELLDEVASYEAST